MATGIDHGPCVEFTFGQPQLYKILGVDKTSRQKKVFLLWLTDAKEWSEYPKAHTPMFLPRGQAVLYKAQEVYDMPGLLEYRERVAPIGRVVARPRHDAHDVEEPACLPSLLQHAHDAHILSSPPSQTHHRESPALPHDPPVDVPDAFLPSVTLRAHLRSELRNSRTSDSVLRVPAIRTSYSDFPALRNSGFHVYVPLRLHHSFIILSFNNKLYCLCPRTPELRNLRTPDLIFLTLLLSSLTIRVCSLNMRPECRSTSVRISRYPSPYPSRYPPRYLLFTLLHATSLVNLFPWSTSVPTSELRPS